MSDIEPRADSPLVDWSDLGVSGLLPTGTVTLLLADVEGSTRLWETQAEALGPVIYGALIGDGSQRFPLFLGYLLGAGVMMVGGLVAWFLAVDAEGKSLEDVATPLAAAGASRRTGSVRAEGATRPTRPESWADRG
jgi:hypothetical protein